MFALIAIHFVIRIFFFCSTRDSAYLMGAGQGTRGSSTATSNLFNKRFFCVTESGVAAVAPLATHHARENHPTTTTATDREWVLDGAWVRLNSCPNKEESREVETHRGLKYALLLGVSRTSGRGSRRKRRKREAGEKPVRGQPVGPEEEGCLYEGHSKSSKTNSKKKN